MLAGRLKSQFVDGLQPGVVPQAAMATLSGHVLQQPQMFQLGYMLVCSRDRDPELLCRDRDRDDRLLKQDVQQPHSQRQFLEPQQNVVHGLDVIDHLPNVARSRAAS